MKDLNSFDIEVQNLKPGDHQYHFEFGNEFFKAFEYSVVEKGDFKVDLTIQKNETLIEMGFEISGAVELVCDRSLDLFDYPMQLNELMVLKYGEEAGEVDERMEIIPWNTTAINVARYIYELITLAIPMKKLHPRYNDLGDERDELIYTSTSESVQGSGSEEDTTWEQLKKLKKET